MGYESYIIVVKKSYSSLMEEKGKKGFALCLSVSDLCKIGGKPAIFNKPTDCFFFFPGPSGGQPVLEDRYGEEVTEASLDDTIEWLMKEYSNEDCRYYRIFVLLQQLLSLKAVSTAKDEYTVLHYGH